MLRLSRSIISQQESYAVSRILLEDGFLGMGNEVQAFETELADFLGVSSEFVISLNSGTAALHLAVQAVLNPGDEILVQSLTYVASFQAISAAGVIPIACEVLPDSITIDLEDAKQRLTPRTKAIMPVHYASNPGDLDAIYAFAKEHGLRVIEDAAHAFGCAYKNRKIGSFGDIICFSFDGIKNITSGEGGAVVTADLLVAERVKDARLLGVEKDTQKRFKNERSWEFDVTQQGYRYHLSNIFAAIGRIQLQRFPTEFAPKRIALAELYHTQLAKISGIKLLTTELGSIIPHIQPILVLQGKRDALRQFLEQQDIQTGIHYKPNHLLSYYGAGKINLPITEQLYNELLSLPLHPGLTENDVGRICDTIGNFFKDI